MNRRVILVILFIFLNGINVFSLEEPNRISLSNLISKLKLKGRAAVGLASIPAKLFEVQDAKVQLGFLPDENIQAVLRFNVNNATDQNPLLDYLFIEAKDFLPWLKDTPWSLNARLGKFKLEFGEETWSNNPIESVVPSNSAANVSAIDEGVELSGKFWVVSFSNGTRGIGADPRDPKAWTAKLFHAFLKDKSLHTSGSFYYSGNLKASETDMSIAGLFSPPSQTTYWKRLVWEIDTRYDLEKGKKTLNPMVFSDSRAIFRMAFGQFYDNVSNKPSRDGQFGFLDTLYNFHKQFYVAGRVSFVDLKDTQTASLNGVITNHYERYSVSSGFRWSENTIFKIGYDMNENGGASVRDNLFSALLVAQF